VIAYLALAASLVFCAGLLPDRGFTPARVWAYTWAVAWVCQALLGSNFWLDGYTAVFVGVCNFAFIAGALMASGQSDREQHRVYRDSARWDRLEASSNIRLLVGAACVLVGLIALNIGLKKLGHPGVASIFMSSFSEFSKLANETKNSMSQGGLYVRSAGVTLATALLTCSAVLSGIELALVRRKLLVDARAQLLAAGVFGFAFLMSAGTGVRSYLLVALLLAASAYFAMKACLTGADFRIPRRLYISGFVAFSMLAIWSVVIQSGRRRDYSFARVSETLDYLRGWVAGFMPALSQWISAGGLQGDLLSLDRFAGSHLLRGVLAPLGFESGQGFDEVVSAVVIGDGASSNAMTIFRVFLQDFGYTGTIIVTFFVGFISQHVYNRVGKGSFGLVVPLTGFYAAILFSVNYWFFAYGSRVLGISLAFVVVLLSDHFKSRSVVADRPVREKPDVVDVVGAFDVAGAEKASTVSINALT
jgi:oligosaccharide repeat unit polymerase